MRLSGRRSMLIAATTFGVLVAVVSGTVATVRHRRELAEREQCRRNLSHLAFSVFGYHSTNGVYPSATLSPGPLPPDQRISWLPLIFTYTDYFQGIRYLFDTNRSWDSTENRVPRVQLRPVGGPDEIVASPKPPRLPAGLMCPSNHCVLGPGMPGPMHYVGIAGLGIDAPSLPAGRSTPACSATTARHESPTSRTARPRL